jgi:hypothetical protein
VLLGLHLEILVGRQARSSEDTLHAGVPARRAGQKRGRCSRTNENRLVALPLVRLQFSPASVLFVHELLREHYCICAFVLAYHLERSIVLVLN